MFGPVRHAYPAWSGQDTSPRPGERVSLRRLRNSSSQTGTPGTPASESDQTPSPPRRRSSARPLLTLGTCDAALGVHGSATEARTITPGFRTRSGPGDGLSGLRHCTSTGAREDDANPKGSLLAIAGIYGGPRKNVFGLMPHPERMSEMLVGGTDGEDRATRRAVERLTYWPRAPTAASGDPYLGRAQIGIALPASPETRSLFGSKHAASFRGSRRSSKHRACPTLSCFGWRPPGSYNSS
jgi:hypothetical protein